jgi:hypothetical protein
MRKNRLFFILVLIFLILISAVSCGKKEVNGGNSPSTSGLKEFSLEKYGFALKYDKLILNDKIDGDQFVELKHLSGDTATVTIKKPDPLIGDKPEEWLKNSFKTSDYKIYQRKEMKLGKYPGLLVEYAWKVMGKPIRTIDLTAYKDGYFYSLIVIMREENVEDVRKEFDKVVKSFNLFDSKVDLDTLQPWKEKIPKNFPFDVVELFGVLEVTSVFGESVTEKAGLTVLYDVAENVKYEDVINYFKETFKDAAGFDFSSGSEHTKIRGTKSGYAFEVELRFYKTLGKTTVTLRVKK